MGSTLDDTDIVVTVGARTEGLAGRETMWRPFFAMTQGPPKIPPGVPAAVVGSVDHHDVRAHRQPKAPSGDPSVGGERINHHERTIQNKVVFESVHESLNRGSGEDSLRC